MAGYIGSKAVNLSTTGADINGDANIDGDLSFRDNDKVIFGAGSDLQIYHDGSNSIVADVGTGNLELRGNNLRLTNAGGNELYLNATSNGDVDLYYDSAVKLSTTSTGIDVTGNTKISGGNLEFSGGTNDAQYIKFGDTSDDDIGNIFYYHGNNNMVFTTNASEAMRIDSSGNLLVGTTTTTNLIGGTGNDGVILTPNHIEAARDGGAPLFLNRTTSNGTIAEFRQNGAVVGSIASKDGDIAIGTGDTGLRFVDGSDAITPHNTSTNVGRGSAIDLGTLGSRFKDLYLTGGVVFGTTGGSVTSKTLEDYEEGTWTPTVTGSSTAGTTTYSTQNGYYTKIGRLVNINCIVNWSSMTGSGFMELKGIPYAIANLSPGSQNYPVGSVLPSNINWTGGTMLVGLGLGGSSIVALYGSSDDGGATRQNCVNESANFRLTMSYMTT